MKKIEISSEELEMMNYNDVAFLILENANKKMKLIDLYNEVSKTMGLDPNDQSHLTDLFELLSTDKRFIMLEEGYWDLRIKHNKGMVIESDEEDEDVVLEEEESEEEGMYEEEKDTESEDDDVEEDDLSDLVIIDDVDEEGNL